MEILCQTLEQAAKYNDFEACKKRVHDLESEAARLEDQTRAKVQKLKHEARLETIKAGTAPVTASPYTDDATRQRNAELFKTKMDELAAEAMIKLQPGNDVWFLESAPGFFRKVKLFGVDVKPADQGITLSYLDKETKPIVFKYHSLVDTQRVTSGPGRFKKGDLVDVQYIDDDRWYEGEVVEERPNADLAVKFLRKADLLCSPGALYLQRRGTFTKGPVNKPSDAPTTVWANNSEFTRLYVGTGGTGVQTVVLPVTLPGKDEATTCRLLQRCFAEMGKPLVFLPPVKTAADLKEEADADADMVPVSKLEFAKDMLPLGPVMYLGQRCILQRIYELSKGGEVLADVYGPAGPVTMVSVNNLTKCD